MKKYKVFFRPLAEADLLGLFHFIAEESGSAVARAYIRLGALAMRGTRRDDYRRANESSASNAPQRSPFGRQR